MNKAIQSILAGRLNPDCYEFGFADLRGLLPPQYAEYGSGIAILRALDNRIIDGILEGLTQDYYNLYNDINRELNAAAAAVSASLSDAGIVNLPLPATVADSELDDAYRRTLTFPVSHKMIATRAGLGWIGKTDLLVSLRFGPRVRLASILLKDRLEDHAAPIDQSRCGACAVCVAACPAQAATGEAWRAGVHRDAYYDAFKCRNYCRAVSKARLGIDISICGRCLAVCPRGRSQGSDPDA